MTIPHALDILRQQYRPHPHLRVAWSQHCAIFAPGGELLQQIQACSEKVRQRPDQREMAYAQLFPGIDAVVEHLRQLGTPEVQWLTVYEPAAPPVAWVLYTGFAGLQESFSCGLICAIDDSPDKPLPVTSDNCLQHGLRADDTEAIRAHNMRLGKQARGCIAGLWSRRTTASGTDPLTGLLRLDIDDGDLTQYHQILRRLGDRGFAFICTPSFSAREGKHKCHLFIHDDRRVRLSVIAAHYTRLAHHVLGDDLLPLYDASQGRPTQLTFLTAVARRLSDPVFTVVARPGVTSWVAALEHVPPEPPPDPHQRHRSAQMRVPRDRSHEADAVHAAWPAPVSPAVIATCDRHRLALVACLRVAGNRQMSELQRLGYLQLFAHNIHMVHPQSTHTYAWLLRQYRADQATTFHI